MIGTRSAAGGASLLIALLVLFAPGGGLAHAGTDHGLQGFASLGLGTIPDYVGSKDYVPTPYADLRLNEGNYYLRFEGADIRANLVNSSQFHAGPLIGFRLGRGDVADKVVSRVNHIKDSLTAGGFLEWSHVHSDPRSAERATLLAAHNVTERDTGWTVSLRGVIRRPLNFVDRGLLAALEADGTWASQNYMQSYFGITPLSAVRSGLPLYTANQGVESVGVGLSLDQFLSRTWSVGVRFHYARLTNAAADSPVVAMRGTPNQFFVGLVVGYVL